MEKEKTLSANDELALRCETGNEARRSYEEIERGVIRKQWHSNGNNHYWLTLATVIAERFGFTVVPLPQKIELTDEQARDYESTTKMWRNGSYANDLVKDIPTGYLVAMTEADPKIPKLKAYVAWRLKNIDRDI